MERLLGTVIAFGAGMGDNGKTISIFEAFFLMGKKLKIAYEIILNTL